MLRDLEGMADPLIQAHVLFLDGTLASTHSDTYGYTTKQFRQARRIFETLNAAHETILVEAALARLAMQQDQLWDAALLIEEAIELAKTEGIQEGAPYYAAALLAFRMGDDLLAKTHTQDAVAAYQHAANTHGLAEAYAFYGLLYLRTDSPDLGLQFTLKAQAMAAKDGLGEIYHSTQVNLALFNALQGLDNHRFYLDAVNAYLAEHHNPELDTITHDVEWFLNQNTQSNTGNDGEENNGFTSVEPLPPPEAVPQPTNP
jgi:tetratricopeptide (TPR) repeat protein